MKLITTPHLKANIWNGVCWPDAVQRISTSDLSDWNFSFIRMKHASEFNISCLFIMLSSFYAKITSLVMLNTIDLCLI